MPAVAPTFLAVWPAEMAYDAAVLRDWTGRGNDLTPNLRINECTLPIRIGRNNDSTFGNTHPQQAYADVAYIGTWRRVTSDVEDAAFMGGEVWPFSTTTSLQNANGYLLCNETTGSTTFADATGRGNTFTMDGSGTATRVAGPFGTDYALRLTDHVYLTLNSPGLDWRSDQHSRTNMYWVKFNSIPSGATSQQGIIVQINNDTGDSGFNSYMDPTALRMVFDADAGDGALLSQGSFTIDQNAGDVTTGVWYPVITKFDKENNRTVVKVGNAAPTFLTPILQPAPTTWAPGHGLQFQLNPSGSFTTKTSGWDVFTGQGVNGNCNLYSTAKNDIVFDGLDRFGFLVFQLSDPDTLQSWAGCYNGDGESGDWLLRQYNGRFYFYLGSSTICNCSVPLTDTGRHIAVFWYRAATGKIYLDLDHGAQTANADMPLDFEGSPCDFRIGSDLSEDGNQARGVYRVAGVCDGTPSQDNLDFLWNNGNFWYPFVADGAETIAASDTPSATRVRAGAVAETGSSTESPSATVAFASSVQTESLTGTDTVAVGAGLIAAQTDSGSATDASTRTILTVAAQVEASTVTDAETVTVALVAFGAEALTVTDVISTSAFMGARGDETLAALETTFGRIALVVAIVEAGGAIDTVRSPGYVTNPYPAQSRARRPVVWHVPKRGVI